MFIYNKIQQGKYRGLDFRFIETGRTSGRKSIFHTYPNSDTVNSEDLGKAPITLSLKIVIHGFGDAYTKSRDEMIYALETEGASLLTHPMYGHLNVQMDGMYSIKERITSSGYAEIDVKFKIVNNYSFNFPDKNTPTWLNDIKDTIGLNLADTFMANMVTDLEEAYKVIKEGTEEVQEVFEKVQKAVFDTIEAFQDFATATSNLINFFPNTISSIGTVVLNLFDQIADTVTDPADQLTAFTNFFDFLDSSSTFTTTTKDNVFAQNNQDAYKTFVQGTALSYAIASASAIDYETVDEIQKVSETILTQFDKVIVYPFINAGEKTIDISKIGKINEDYEVTSPLVLYADLQSQKVAFYELLKDKILYTPRTTTVTIVNESLIIFVYRYYGSLDNYDTIRNMNNIIDSTSFLDGEYTIMMGADEN